MKKPIKSLLAASVLVAPLLLLADALSAQEPKPNRFWWPDQIDLTPLRQHASESNPIEGFDYAKAFSALDLNAVKQDIKKVLNTSQEWWPADYGNYGPFFIRMAWHSAGTYRVQDGRGGAGGGQQRFDPLNSWPDNANLDKARRLLWPVKQKYGRSLSWADLIVLTGNVSLESMGFKTFGYAGGRQDDWEPDLVYWGPEKKWLEGDMRYKGDRQLENPLAAVQMGLIYVNPEGPNGKPDPLAAARDIRDTFGRMAMNDEETVALIADGHTFGKAHGYFTSLNDCVGPEPGGCFLSRSKAWAGRISAAVYSGGDTLSPWPRRRLDSDAHQMEPRTTSRQLLQLRLGANEEPGRRHPVDARQWRGARKPPDAHDPNKRHAPMMFTTDLALKEDPEYRKIAKRFQEHPEEFQLAFSKAWFKLTHRDMGPRARYLGPEVPSESPHLAGSHPGRGSSACRRQGCGQAQGEDPRFGLTVPELVRTAWASAASFHVAPTCAAVRTARAFGWPRRRIGRSTIRLSFPRF
ncbi:MAG: peroxidase family protein [Bryobacterales bacterium]